MLAEKIRVPVALIICSLLALFVPREMEAEVGSGLSCGPVAGGGGPFPPALFFYLPFQATTTDDRLYEERKDRVLMYYVAAPIASSMHEAVRANVNKLQLSNEV